MKSPNPAPAGVDAPELLEDQTLLVRGNAWPVILDADEDRALIRGGGTHLDLVSRDRVLGGVRQEVDEQLAEPVAVAAHDRQRLDHARRHRNLVGSERDHGRGLANEVANVDVPEDVGERSRLDPRRVEDVADQGRQPSRLLLDEREERFALLGGQLAPARA